MTGVQTCALPISSGESGGKYTAYNVKSGDKYIPRYGSELGKPITEMKIGEIRSLQDKGALFAAGKFQIIPQTLQDAINKGVVGLNDLYNQDTQDKLFDYLLSRRPKALKYINGDPGVTRDEAITELAKEWAALGVPGTGLSYYAKNKFDKASVSPEKLGAVLDDYRAATIASKTNIIPPQIGTNIDNTSRDNSVGIDSMSSNISTNVINNNFTSVTSETQKRENQKYDDRSVIEKKGLFK